MLSLRMRLLLAGSLVLLVFIGLCGAGLEKAFRNSALDAQEERLRGLVYALLGAANQDPRGDLVLNNIELPEPRLTQPDSGLEAALLDETGKELWRSPSALTALPVVIGPEVGNWKFERLDEDGRFVLSFGLRWIADDKMPRPAGSSAAGWKRYTALVLEDPQAYETQLLIFRRTLWLWLLGAAAGLLAALLLVQRWGLAPLRRLTGELRSVETGTRPQIDSAYPAELAPLTGALNAMIRSERSQLARYRNALSDLAHSLKTPLAVLRGLERHPQSEVLNEQIGRMQQIVDHQLGKAATAGRRALAQPVALLPVAEKVLAALRKVYADKQLDFRLAVTDGLHVRMDSGDLYELLGNLLDNAGKWSRNAVRLRAVRETTNLILDFEDDGAGFPEDAERLLQRFVRADSKAPGQGLGLAAAAEIVRAYEGQIQLARSAELKGARVMVTIPA
jgi:two-component system sensor histidine kinase PhoQ